MPGKVTAERLTTFFTAIIAALVGKPTNIFLAVIILLVGPVIFISIDENASGSQGRTEFVGPGNYCLILRDASLTYHRAPFSGPFA
jgi:hypothetical protein